MFFRDISCSLSLQIKEFSVSRLSDFSLTYLEDGFVHWGYRSAKDSSTPADGFYRKGKVTTPASPPEELTIPCEEIGNRITKMGLELSDVQLIFCVETDVVLYPGLWCFDL